MSVDTTLAVLYAQSGLSTNIANAAMVAPQAAMAMSRLLALEHANQEKQQVKKNEKSGESKINQDQKDNSARYSARHRPGRQKQENTEVLATTAFLGNLLNVKV